MNTDSEFACSGDWALYDIRLTAGLELILERDFADGVELRAPQPRRQVAFEAPASWAFIDMSLILQYFPHHDCSPVIEELTGMDTLTFTPGFTINTETHGAQWRHFRVTTHSDIVDVVARDTPAVTARQDL